MFEDISYQKIKFVDNKIIIVGAGNLILLLMAFHIKTSDGVVNPNGSCLWPGVA